MYTHDEIKKLGPVADAHFPGMDLTAAVETALKDSPDDLEYAILSVTGLIGGMGQEAFEIIFNTPVELMPVYVVDETPWKCAVAEWRLLLGH